jgi:hypothetical protein
MHRFRIAVAILALAVRSGWAAELEPARTHAVLIGVLEWQHGLTAFPKVNRKDVELRDVLVRRGVPAENITLLVDAEATLANIRDAMAKTVKKAPPGSTLIIYYAGHGWPMGDSDYCLANYDVQMNDRASAWSMNELGSMLVKDFRGKQVFLWADCCYSGGMHVVVDALAKRQVAAFSLTSAGLANTSTRNWTFTQSIIDGLRGEPMVDANADGEVTLVELSSEVSEAMTHLEGQAHGFKANGVGADFVISKSAGRRPNGKGAKFPIGSYVEVSGGGRRHFGRIIAAEGDYVTVQFYIYTEKRTVKFAAADVKPSKRIALAATRLDVGVRPDCLTEWRGTWFPAKILKRDIVDDKPRFFIHYLGYDNSWDEWVGSDRIRLMKENTSPSGRGRE